MSIILLWEVLIFEVYPFPGIPHEKNLECWVPFRHFGQSLSRSAHESPLITITHHGWRRRHRRFGSEQIITFIAMATPDDLNANAEFIRLADSFVEVPGAAPSFFFWYVAVIPWRRSEGEGGYF